MAPRKEKTEKISADEAAATILNYLRKQNRPYSATDISANLHNKVTKAATAKILKDLHERNEIEGRNLQPMTDDYPIRPKSTNNSHKNPNDAVSPEALDAIDEKISELRTYTTNFLVTAKTLRGTLSSLNSSLTTADLIASVSALDAEKAEIQARLESLKAGKAKKVTKQEREAVEAEWNKWSRVSKKREKMSGEMWTLIVDFLPEEQDKGDVRESLGLDD
ncbi:hypothetical protein BCR34DRAFT_532319 [Clohesyomyces aquaticus]|uniref:Homologous-pairing protein 2 winged helix domain-containing protein n=1 Tax=Clohesyomyces aquaticus TaxID=1231657 RepID=A0A1Y1ZZW2_9PLEO|nr:hypothetical protein BCR34DRAFT_532319 [Clohesyomyces aquaticus]